MTEKTVDELVEEGERLSQYGNFVLFLYPSQEWIAVQKQMPFLRYGMISDPEDDYAQRAEWKARV